MSLISGDNGGYISDLCYLTVKDGAACATPEPISKLKATAAEKGELSVTIEFKTPSLDIAGNALSSLASVDIYRDDVKIGSGGKPHSRLRAEICGQRCKTG